MIVRDSKETIMTRFVELFFLQKGNFEFLLLFFLGVGDEVAFEYKDLKFWKVFDFIASALE